MFQYISVFLSHYPPKRPAPRGFRRQNSYKPVPSLVRSSRFRSVYHHALVQQVARSLWECACHHVAPSQFSVIYLCITHAVEVLLASHLSTPSWYMELLHFYFTTHCLQNKHTCILYFLAPGLSWCVSGCVKGASVSIEFSFSWSFILF